jgi:hypothetical protein
MRRIRRLVVREQRGSTLPEVICSIVLLGMVFSPICMAVAMALRVPVQTTARSQQASSRTLLINQWTLDAESALQVNLWTAPNSGVRRPLTNSSSTCPSDAGAPRTDEVVEFVWNDITQSTDTTAYTTNLGPLISADYRLNYSKYNASVRKVDLVRIQTGGNHAGTRTILSGYCATNDVVLTDYDDDTGKDGTNTYYGSRREHAQFNLRDAPNDVPRFVNLEASSRTSCKNLNLGIIAPTTSTPDGTC